MTLSIIHVHPSAVAAERTRETGLVIANANVPIGERWIVLPAGQMVIAHRAGKA